MAFLEALPETSFPRKTPKKQGCCIPKDLSEPGPGPCHCPLFPGQLLTLAGKGEGRRPGKVEVRVRLGFMGMVLLANLSARTQDPVTGP